MIDKGGKCVKRIINGLLIVFMAVILVACSNESNETVTISDKHLEAEIKATLDITDASLTKKDLTSIQEIEITSKKIKDLSGIEQLTKLERLTFLNEPISDYAPLASLPALKELHIHTRAAKLDSAQRDVIEKLRNKGISVTLKDEEPIGDPDGAGGYLWKIENGQTTVYLQGTIHAGTKDFYPLNTHTEQAYLDADIVVPEVDITSLNLLETSQLLISIGTYQDGTTIEDHIPKKLYTKLSKYMEKEQIPQQMEMYRPWVLSSMLDSFMLEKLGYTYGVDEYFLKKAKKDQKEIIALETAESQLSVFADTSEAYQIQMLEETLTSMESYEDDMLELFSLYLAGDEKELLNTLTGDTEEEPNPEEEAFMKVLNDDRNIAMADQIEHFLEEDQNNVYFVIVGTLHLIQEPHIVSLLQEKGYEVERVY